MSKNKTLNEIADYYSDKITTHGNVPAGVDWNGEESQNLRFQQLSKIINKDGFSLNDIGCGYGAYFDFLNSAYKELSYFGYDISEEMVKAASKAHKTHNKAHFFYTGEPSAAQDYSVASGIFNVQLECPEDEWQQYILDTLHMMDKHSSKGFSFNCLTKYSDADKMRDYLYYADPCELFDYCKINFSKDVALLHDYGLYEFTILVRKEA